MSVAGRPFTPVLHRLSHSRLVKRDSSRVQSRSDGRVNDLDKYERMVSSAPVEEASRSQSTWLAIGAVATTAFVFLASKSLNSDSALDRLRASATPLDVALSSGKPTVVEFYADWCEVCQELAPMTLEVEEQYQDRVNFSLLNVENSKWQPEVAEYGVRGIPHFVFLDKDGRAQAAAVGRLPKEVLQEDVKALAASKPLPFRNKSGPTSSLTRSTERKALAQVNPRDHSLSG